MAEFSEKDFDVIGFAKSLMSEIESVRSFKQFKDDKTGEGFQLPTESRLNAFFRLIGLPYFIVIKDKDNTESVTLHPGFGATVRSKLADKTVEDSDIDYTDVNGNSGKLRTILADRVRYLSETANSMGSKKMNERIAKAMYAPIDIVPNIPDKLTGKGEFVPKIPPKNGNDTQNKRVVFKKLFPLIPTVSDNQSHRVVPLKNEIARPFTLDVKERRIDSETILRKPFLEQVIRIRFLKFGSSETTKQKSVETDMTSSLKQLLGDDDYTTIFGSDQIFTKVTVLEEFIINKFINAIGNLARRWVKINEDRVRLLRQTRPNIVIKTGSSKESPFGKRVETSVDLDGTSEGKKIKELNRMIAKDEALLALLPTDEDEDTHIKQSKTRNVTPNALQDPFVDLLTYNLKKNKETRTALTTKSQRNIKALEKIRLEVVDLMTGEFTGLSLPDIIMVLAGLFTMNRDKLLDLLDKYAIDSMKDDKVLKTIIERREPTPAKTMAAIQELEKRVNQMFQLFQKEIETTNDRQQRSRKGVLKKIYADKSAQQPEAKTCTVYKGES